MADLIERLRATKPSIFTIKGIRTAGSYDKLINPDGPEAAERIEALEANLESAHSDIRELYTLLSDVFENPIFQITIGSNPILIDQLMKRVNCALNKIREQGNV